MSDSQCPPGPPPPEELESPPLLIPPAIGRTRLVTIAKSPRPVLTNNREVDAVTALKRGLKEYLEQMYIDVAGERVRFIQVFDVFSDTDTVARFPSAAITVNGEAEYDYSSLTPALNPDMLVQSSTNPSDTKTYLIKYAEVTCTLSLEFHCSTPGERISINMMLEDALNPVDWMYGFKLDLPHYYNVRAIYSPMTTQMVDTEDSARRHWRVGTIMLGAQIQLLRPRNLPSFKPKLDVTVTDGSDESST